MVSHGWICDESQICNYIVNPICRYYEQDVASLVELMELVKKASK